VSPVKYELGFYIPEDDILHSHCRENFKSATEIVSYYIINGCTALLLDLDHVTLGVHGRWTILG
jgi:hypothetical protein